MFDNVLIKKLQRFVPLSDEDRKLLGALSQQPRCLSRNTDLIQTGDQPSSLFLVLEGMACRYKINANGDRQIVGLLTPGDISDLHASILREMDHSIAALTECTISAIPRDQVLPLLDRPAIARALRYATLVDEATLREWLANIGSRPAAKRLAHLICELHLRMATVGLASEGEFRLPISQLEFADLLGISVVHTNRSMQALRKTGMITIDGPKVQVLDIEGLQTFADFNADYLHLSDGPAQRDTDTVFESSGFARRGNK